jgi:hypothetical protein
MKRFVVFVAAAVVAMTRQSPEQHREARGTLCTGDGLPGSFIGLIAPRSVDGYRDIPVLPIVVDIIETGKKSTRRRGVIQLACDLLHGTAGTAVVVSSLDLGVGVKSP